MKSLREVICEALNPDVLKKGTVVALKNEYYWIEIDSVWSLEKHKILKKGTTDLVTKALTDLKCPVQKSVDKCIIFPAGSSFKYVGKKEDDGDEYEVFEYIYKDKPYFEIGFSEYDYPGFCKYIDKVK